MFKTKAPRFVVGALLIAPLVRGHSPYLLPDEFEVRTRDHVSMRGCHTYAVTLEIGE